jgi:ubiquinone/menaquinone biosynthesis C-methylase UbiE
VKSDFKNHNLEEYENPVLYDKENNGYTEDIPFLQKWAAISSGPIIDLACGTGRATIPLAEKGYQMIGVDIHHGMLQEAQRKSKQLDIKWVEQDCTHLNLKVRSTLIYMVGNSFQHFHTNEEQDALLSAVYRHLKAGGYFIFGTRFPNSEELLQPNTEEYWRSYIDNDTGQSVDMYTISTYHALSQIQHYETIRKVRDNAGMTIEEKSTQISLRYVFPKEMERLLSHHGFEIAHAYKDWKETPMDQDSGQMVYVCRKV